MKNIVSKIFIFFALVWTMHGVCNAQDISLEPKYGLAQKNAVQNAADVKFLADIDSYYKGDRKTPANEMAARGWKALQDGNMQDAMRRFNQAWLIDNANGAALWGMGAIQANTGKASQSLSLFAEAEPTLSGDTNFEVDYAKAISIAGAQTKNVNLMTDAVMRFEQVYQKDPQHTSNLQNWAICLFYMGDYAAAWRKIQLAENTPGRSGLDQRFIESLKNKLPKPE